MDYINIGRCFSILHRRSQLFVTAACERLHLTYSEYVMLLRIFSSEGLSQDELAALLLLDKAVVTRTAAMLEEKGMIRREKDGRDRRMKRLYPTEQAKAEKNALEEILRTWVDFLRQDMPEEEAEAVAGGVLSLSEKACRANIPELVRELDRKRPEETR